MLVSRVLRIVHAWVLELLDVHGVLRNARERRACLVDLIRVSIMRLLRIELCLRMLRIGLLVRQVSRKLILEGLMVIWHRSSRLLKRRR